VSAGIFNLMRVLAEGAGDAAAKGAEQAPGSAITPLLTFLLPLAILFYFMIMRPERRKQADHKSLLDSLKKNDRVITIGGVYGVVANVQRDSDRVTLKVDETNNTKMDFTFSSIARVIVDDAPTETK
jgi:preprotein translocase subunit YajC